MTGKRLWKTAYTMLQKKNELKRLLKRVRELRHEIADLESDLDEDQFEYFFGKGSAQHEN